MATGPIVDGYKRFFRHYPLLERRHLASVGKAEPLSPAEERHLDRLMQNDPDLLANLTDLIGSAAMAKITLEDATWLYEHGVFRQEHYQRATERLFIERKMSGACSDSERALLQARLDEMKAEAHANSMTDEEVTEALTGLATGQPVRAKPEVH